MRWPVNKEQSDYMRIRQLQNKARIGSIAAEEWAWKSLRTSGLKWSRQVRWGCRIFDFWCSAKGIAIEIDGPSHDLIADSARDEYNFLRSGILVLRVPNGNEPALSEAIATSIASPSWKERRESLGLNVNSKKGRRARLAEAGIPCATGHWKPPELTITRDQTDWRYGPTFDLGRK